MGIQRMGQLRAQIWTRIWESVISCKFFKNKMTLIILFRFVLTTENINTLQIKYKFKVHVISNVTLINTKLRQKMRKV